MTTTPVAAPAVPTSYVLSLVADERARQDIRWGESNHELGIGAGPLGALAGVYRDLLNTAAENGEVTWAHIALKKFFEALGTDDPTVFAKEAIEAMAVLSAAIESESRRNPSMTLPPPF